MNELETVVIKSRCADVIARYALAVNEWDLDAFVGLFAPDAVWQRPATEPMVGHPAIRAFMEAQPTDKVMRHVNGGILVDPVDDDHARAWSQTTVYDDRESIVLPARTAAPDMVVEYRDELVKIDGSWLIARRDTTIVFQSDLPGPVIPVTPT